MSAAMHFRKRQILEYQIEANLKFLAEKKDAIFPSPPSSLESKTPSPVKDVAEPASVYAPIEHTRTKPTLAINEALQLTPYPVYNYAPQFNPIDLSSSSPMKQEAEAWAYAAAQLMQSIESTLMQQMQTALPNDQKPSALLMAKFNYFQGKSSPKPEQVKKPVSPKPTPKPKPTPNPPTKNLKAKRANKIKNTVMMNHAISPQPLPYVKGKLDLPRLYDIIGVDPSCVKEVAAESAVFEEQMVPIDMSIKPSHSSFEDPEPKPVPLPKSKEELQYIGNRIKRIMAKENVFKQNVEQFAENGVHVYEQVDLDYTQKSEDIIIRSENSIHTYKYTPPVENRSPKKPFVHITADTLPEKLNHLTTVAGIVNPPGEEKPPQIYPYTSKDDSEKFVIGPNGTLISKARWYEIDWKLAPPAVTRKVLMGVFNRDILATHSLSGRPSPAFMNLNKPEKRQLDVKKVADVISLLTNRINVTQKEVRMAITSKCADECKIIKIKANEGKLKAEKENARFEPYFIPVNSPIEE